MLPPRKGENERWKPGLKSLQGPCGTPSQRETGGKISRFAGLVPAPVAKISDKVVEENQLLSTETRGRGSSSASPQRAANSPEEGRGTSAAAQRARLGGGEAAPAVAEAGGCRRSQPRRGKFIDSLTELGNIS